MTHNVFVLLLKDKAKKGDINGYRPIAILNSDIRIIHQILNIRLQSLLKGIVLEHQTAFIPGRSISTNIHLRQLLFIDPDTKFISRNPYQALIMVYFKKAYDMLGIEYIHRVLEHLGLGPHFINAVMGSIIITYERGAS